MGATVHCNGSKLVEPGWRLRGSTAPMERCWLCLLQRQLVQQIRLDGRTEIGITTQQQHLNTSLAGPLQHGIERRPAAGVDIGEGIVEEHRQHTVVGGG